MMRNDTARRTSPAGENNKSRENEGFFSWLLGFSSQKTKTDNPASHEDLTSSISQTGSNTKRQEENDEVPAIGLTMKRSIEVGKQQAEQSSRDLDISHKQARQYLSPEEQEYRKDFLENAQEQMGWKTPPKEIVVIRHLLQVMNEKDEDETVRILQQFLDLEPALIRAGLEDLQSYLQKASTDYDKNKGDRYQSLFEFIPDWQKKYETDPAVLNDKYMVNRPLADSRSAELAADLDALKKREQLWISRENTEEKERTKNVRLVLEQKYGKRGHGDFAVKLDDGTVAWLEKKEVIGMSHKDLLSKFKQNKNSGLSYAELLKKVQQVESHYNRQTEILRRFGLRPFYHVLSAGELADLIGKPEVLAQDFIDGMPIDGFENANNASSRKFMTSIGDIARGVGILQKRFSSAEAVRAWENEHRARYGHSIYDKRIKARRDRVKALEIRLNQGENVGELLDRAKKNLAEVKESVRKQRNPEDVKISEWPLYRFGEAINEKARETFKLNPEYDDSFWAKKLPEAFGGTAANSLMAAFGGIGTGYLLTVGQHAAERYDEAVKKNLPPDEALKSAGLSFLTAAPGSVPFMKFASSQVPAARALFTGVAGEIYKNAGQETAVKFTELVIKNAISKGIYNEETQSWSDVSEEILLAIITGASKGVISETR